MILSRFRALVLVGALVCSAAPALADPITLDFESLSDFESLTNQFADLSFLNATVLVAGTTLNEFDFPPRSGSNVIFNNGGDITINFAASVYSFSAFFTYITPVTLTAYDAANNVLGTVTSLLAENFAGSLTPNPNELLAFSSLVGINSITLGGLDGSFVVDDLTYDNERPDSQQPQQVPEPDTMMVLMLGASIALAVKHFRMPA